MKLMSRGPDLRRCGRVAFGRGLAALRDFVYGLPAYRFTLIGRRPRRLALHPPDPWPGDAARGRAILEGDFSLHVSERPGDDLLRADGAPPRHSPVFHGFAWLRDLRAVGGDAARARARALVEDWIAHNPRWTRRAWRGDVLARRICAWIEHDDFFAAGADDPFRVVVLGSLARQARHLARALPAELEGAALLAAIKGLIYAGLALPGRQAWLARGLALLEREVARQILPDGGHVERCPSLQLSVLRDFVDIRAALAAGGYPVPDHLQTAIDRMAPMLRFFRLGDGGLALFNGGEASEPWLVDMVLTRADARGKPLSAAPHSGFQRLLAGRTIVIADVGAPATVQWAADIEDRAHAGTLSFEMSAGRDRLVVNCGAHGGDSPDWSRAQRTTAAHSTLIVADTNSAEILGLGRLWRGQRTVSCRREERADVIAIEATHDGYAAPFGLLHARRLALESTGHLLAGEDRLIPIGRGRGRRQKLPFALRFHLHPDVRAAASLEGGAVLLRPPSGHGWRFAAQGGRIAIEDSVYLGGPGELVRRSQQITVSGEVDPRAAPTPIAWTLARIAESG